MNENTHEAMASTLRNEGVLASDTSNIELKPDIEAEILDSVPNGVEECDISDRFYHIPPSRSLEYRGGEIFITNGESLVAHWHSEAALFADVAAEPILQNKLDEWPEWHLRQRAHALELVRIGLSKCPNCRGEIDIASEQAEKSCASKTIQSVICTGCKSPLVVSY